MKSTRNHHKRATLLGEEIDLYTSPTPFWVYLLGVVFAIVMALTISDWIWGSETVTYWIASFF